MKKKSVELLIAIFVAVGHDAHRTLWKLSEPHFPNVIQDFYRYGWNWKKVGIPMKFELL